MSGLTWRLDNASTIATPPPGNINGNNNDINNNNVGYDTSVGSI